MKRTLLQAALATLALLALTTTSAFAADVGVSITIGDPNFYGRIELGGYPTPQLLYPRPFVIDHTGHYREPLYLRVPPGHIKRWSEHCREYGACDREVYFVRDDWYNREYVPRYQQRHQYRPDDRRDDRRYDRRDDRRDGQKGEHGSDHNRGRGR
jgi:hypothetical protein